jgi:uncharacterized membrane protein
MGPPAGSAAPPPPPPPNPNPGYSNPPYGNPQGGNPQYNNPQYGNPQAGNPQYGNPQYGNPQPPPGNNPYYQGGAPGAVAQSGLEENVACALCYALTVITGILFLVLAPYNQNRLIRFHAFQAIMFWAAAVAIWIVKFILFTMLIAIPFVGAMLSIMISALLSLGFLIVWAMLIYKAYNRERWVLPIIGPLAEKQA